MNNKLLMLFCLCGQLVLSQWAMALPPVPFEAQYRIKFLGGFRADATLELVKGEEEQYSMSSAARLKFFGKTLTTVNANSTMVWENDYTIPLSYQYTQTGIGRRTSNIDYDWPNSSAATLNDDETITLALEARMLDELSMYVEIQQQAAAGVEDIFLSVIDEGVIKEYHYQYQGEEQLDTEMGLFNTVKYLRVRESKSSRQTEIWMAADWDYLVLELAQKTRLRTFKIYLREAMIGGVAVTSLPEPGNSE